MFKCLFLLFFPLSLFAQFKVEGRITDKTSLAPVPYVNIGIQEKGIGTVSGDDGTYEIHLTPELRGRFLTFSRLGYEDYFIEITDQLLLSGLHDVGLESVSIQLNNVHVKTGNVVVIGFKPTNDKAKGFFSPSGLGGEAGALIPNKDSVFLTHFNMNILSVTFDSLRFRLNFYSVKKGKPFNKLNKQDIVFVIKKNDSGIHSIPLMDHDLVMNSDFISTLELLQVYGNSNDRSFFYSASLLPNASAYRRKVSQDKWERFKKVTTCFWFYAVK